MRVLVDEMPINCKECIFNKGWGVGCILEAKSHAEDVAEEDTCGGYGNIITIYTLFDKNYDIKNNDSTICDYDIKKCPYLKVVEKEHNSIKLF